MNLLTQQWNYSLPWSNYQGISAAFERNVLWFPNNVTFRNVKEVCEGWRMDENWNRVTSLADYSCGMIVSKEQYHFGVYTIKCQLPDFRGSFPAMWLFDCLPNGQKLEVDIMEQFRKDANCLSRNKITVTYHDDKTMTSKAIRGIGSEVTCQLIWLPEVLRWVVNGKQVMEVKRSDVTNFPDKPLNLIVNSGIGDWGVQDDKLDSFLINKLTYEPYTEN